MYYGLKITDYAVQTLYHTLPINKAFVGLGSCNTVQTKGQSSNMQTGQDFK